jgi:hypothetical protein
MHIINKWISALFIVIFLTVSSNAQIAKAPDRAEGDGQYSQLIIRGVTLINGTGAPAYWSG